MKVILSTVACLIMVLSLYAVSGCKAQPKVDSTASIAQTADKAPSSVTEHAAAENAPDLLVRINSALSGVAEKVKPSVVNISTTTTVSMKESPFGDMFNDPFFRRFFGDQLNPHGGQKKFKTSALGSGVIVSEDGYILTNNHVVQNVDEIKVILSDRTELTGKLIGTDPQTDLAIVKVKAKDLPAIKIGDSGNLKVGELVIAVGNPFALGNTITMGIVSAVGRSHVGIADYEDFIQTDAAINPGNSGGALVNIHGELVGINTAIFSTTGGNVGIGFAVPTAMARSVMDSIIKHGKVIRGWLGVSIQNLTPELSKHFEVKKDTGTLVADVVKDSPAERAGLKRGDLITEFEGDPVQDSTGLRNMVSARQPGTVVKIKVVRLGKEMTISVKLGELPQSVEAQKSSFDNVMEGVNVQNLTPDIKASLGIPQQLTGVIITNIDGDSPAAEDLRQNDVIQEINKKSIRTIKDYNEVVSSIKPDENVLMLVYRGGGFIYIAISP